MPLYQCTMQSKSYIYLTPTPTPAHRDFFIDSTPNPVTMILLDTSTDRLLKNAIPLHQIGFSQTPRLGQPSPVQTPQLAISIPLYHLPHQYLPPRIKFSLLHTLVQLSNIPSEIGVLLNLTTRVEVPDHIVHLLLCQETLKKRCGVRVSLFPFP